MRDGRVCCPTEYHKPTLLSPVNRARAVDCQFIIPISERAPRTDKGIFLVAIQFLAGLGAVRLLKAIDP